MESHGNPPPRVAHDNAGRSGRVRLLRERLRQSESCAAWPPVLPVREAHGEGDQPKAGGGANSAARPSTALRAVPLPTTFGRREDWRSVLADGEAGEVELRLAPFRLDPAGLAIIGIGFLDASAELVRH